MGLEIFPDAGAFLERTETFLYRNEAANNLLLSAASALVQNPSIGAPFFAAHSGPDGIDAAAVWIPGHKAVVSDGPAEAGTEFARQIAQRSPSVPGSLPGVLAPPRMMTAFAAECEVRLAVKPRYGLEQVVMKLDFSKFPNHALFPNGRLRRAWLEDYNILRQWAQAMVIELKLHEAPQETARITRRAIEGRRLFVWDDGGPVAMYGHSGNTPRGARINSVYVPPEKRRQGYAFAGVWRLSELLRQAGKSFACLFADRHSEASLRLYRRLGYEVVGALDEARF